MKEILIYSGIYSFTAESFIEKLAEIPKDEDVTVRLNSPGGSVFAGWGMIAALKERTGKNILKVDGNASSMAFFLVPFFDEVQALDVTSFMVHRATAYIDTDDDQKMLDDANATLRKTLESRIKSDVFEQVTGVSIKDVFEAEKRRDIWITAKDAKKIGLVDKVTRLTPREIEAFENKLVAILPGAEAEQSQGSEQATNTDNNESKKVKQMTKEKLKAEFPQVYAEIVQDEKDRVESWLAFADVDFEACKTGIEEDKPVTQKVIAQMARKAMTANEAQTIEAESDNEVDTPEEETTTQEDKELEKAEKEAAEAAGITL